MLVAVAARWDGVSLLGAVVVRLRWWLSTTRGHTSYRAGVMVAGEHAWGLPGVLAPTQLLSVPDPAGDFGVVANPRTRTMTVTLRCAATSTWLADPDEGAAWVASWGAFLASLGHHPRLHHVAVTVDSAPDPGTRLADHIAARILPARPGLGGPRSCASSSPPRQPQPPMSTPGYRSPSTPRPTPATPVRRTRRRGVG